MHALKGKIVKSEIGTLMHQWRDAQNVEHETECRDLAMAAFRAFSAWAWDKFPRSELDILRKYKKTDTITGLNFAIYNEINHCWDVRVGIKFPDNHSVECVSGGWGSGQYQSVYVGGPKDESERIMAAEPIAYRALELRNDYAQREAVLRSYLETRPLRRDLAHNYPALAPTAVVA